MEEGARRRVGGAERFSHEVVFYDGAGARPGALLPFIREGVAAGEPVLVALPGAAIASLQRQLGSEAEEVEFVDIVEVGSNPACIIPVWRRFVAENSARGRLRGIGEPAWAGRRHAELIEAALHEALLNVAFDDGPGWRLLCPYDVDQLPRWVIDEARRTHPHVHATATSDTGYAGPEHAADAFGHRLPAAPASAHRFAFGIDELGEVRDRVRRAGAQAGLGEAVVDDLVLAAHELATNSVLHADGKGQLVLWVDPDALVVQVEDAGRIEDPLVGRTEPDAAALGGRGIWMVNQLCDLVQVRSDVDGTQVRLHTWL